MSIVRFEKVSLAYGLKPLLDEVDFSIEKNKKLCLLGRNGEGKSSLMNLLTQKIYADSGEIVFEKSLKIGFLPQSLPEADEKKVFDVVAEGLFEVGGLLAEYHALLEENSESEAGLLSLQDIQNKIESLDGWRFQDKITHMLKRFGLNDQQKMNTLSGGWRRRVLLAKSLINEPDLLLLDEPTNHLDINTIKWLEQVLKEFSGALMFVSHDRAFIKALASGIVELDRGCLTVFSGSYDSYLSEKQKLLEEEAHKDKLFDKRLSEEEVWIRQGIKARRTRNEGRVRALKKLRVERTQRIDKQGSASINIQAADRSGKLVVELTSVSHGFDEDQQVIENLNLTVLRGDRIGLIGSNGAGKTTLLRILLGKLEPKSGSVRQGSKIEAAYFDQLRDGLNPEKSVYDNVADGHDYVTLNNRQRHVIGYLNDFLFTAERARTPVKALSGGETNRLLLAKLFSRPANVIVMDEPTNDLDVDTLELLEDRLNDFPGTLLLTCHDRDFLDHVVTSTLVFEGRGKVTEYVGGYNDWVRQTGGEMADESCFSGAKNTLPSSEARVDFNDLPLSNTAGNLTLVDSSPDKKKLSYKFKRELDLLPERIDYLEKEIVILQAKIAAPDFFGSPRAEVESVTLKLSEAEKDLAVSIERWLELEDSH